MMKKIFILFIIFAITGCGSNSKGNTKETYSFKYNDDYYQIHLPYKKGVGNYIVSSSVVDFDVEAIEKDLIQISSNVFSIDDYYYEEGQYLTTDHLKKLLSREYLNKSEEKEISKHKVTPTVIAGIYEKNFVDSNGVIKGMSLGLVLNPYQSYDSHNNYVTMKNDDVVDYAKKASYELITYIRDTFDLKDITIMIALYVESSPESNVGGNYLYYGYTKDNEIIFNYIDQKNYYLNNSTVKKLDPTSYNNFNQFKDKIYKYDSNIYISGLGHFTGNSLVKLDITITKSNYSYGELLYISQLLSDNIIEYFKDVRVVIEVKAINEIKSYIVKEDGETSTDIFIY